MDAQYSISADISSLEEFLARHQYVVSANGISLEEFIASWRSQYDEFTEATHTEFLVSAEQYFRKSHELPEAVLHARRIDPL